MSVLFVFALFENISVLVLYSSDKKLQSKTNLWIVSVVVCDLLIVVGAFPFLIIASFAQEYIFGLYGCKLDGFLVTLLGSSSIFLLTGLSIHRYFIMIFGTKTRMYKRRNIKLCIMACFILGLFWGITPLIGWGSFAHEGINISCAPNWRSQRMKDLTYTIALYVCVLFTPLVVMAYCYFGILFKVILYHLRVLVITLKENCLLVKKSWC
jgi:hypothetical protein